MYHHQPNETTMAAEDMSRRTFLPALSMRTEARPVPSTCTAAMMMLDMSDDMLEPVL